MKYWWLWLVGVVLSCQPPSPSTLFTLLLPSETGITFANHLAESDTFNILNYLYYYNGGGVAIGDLNRDGRADVFFTANEGADQLYLNQGNFQFQNVSEAAGISGARGWSTGVTMADVNGDGWLDIYVSQLGQHEGVAGRNQLYINDADTSRGRGYPTFTEQAAAYGLDQQTYATQAAFFDYDLDGDLDVYLLNHTIHSADTYVPVVQGRRASPQGDQLLRNDGNYFVDVSEKAGIYRSQVGYGLSVAVADLDQDGWPDIYVGNDFHENDYLYYNNGDGTFSERIEQAIGHTSRFTMGSDVADFNNDALPDIITLDMKPEDERVLKTSAGEDPYDIYQFKLSYGYHHQNARNALQLSVGDSLYSEIAQLAGVAATDWSWAPLFVDLNNDGWKDLYITNGILRRPNNLDYIRYISNREIQRALEQGTAETTELVKKMPSEAVANYAYRNNGDLTFSNQATAWGLAQPGFSNGAAYGDLDNDGDLDLVVNNVNRAAFVYRNNTSSDQHSLRVRLVGAKNTYGVGGKAWLYTSAGAQYQELMPTRGFQSSIEPVIHFGLGEDVRVDSLVVVWPDRKKQTIRSPLPDTTYVLQSADAHRYHYYATRRRSPVALSQIQTLDTNSFYHREDAYVDFSREPFLPWMLSREGPALAVGDVNQDGLEDVYLGGATGQAGKLLLQQADGSLTKSQENVWQADRQYEDVAAAWLDADNDGDPDLYVGSAGNRFSDTTLADRLYINDGRGGLQRAEDALPERYENTACVAPNDIDHDGDLDIFVGVRNVSGHYGIAPTSYLLENKGMGRFTTHDLPLDGMVTAATWTDYDQDGWEDLVVVGDWMPITLLKNHQGYLQPVTVAALDSTHGWWRIVKAADLDNDGDADWVVGNVGHNTLLNASVREPVSMYVHDFDQNGTVDQLLTYYRQGEEHAIATKDELTKQMPSLRKKFTDYATYANLPFATWFSTSVWSEAKVRRVYLSTTGWVENQGDGNFVFHSLPVEAQFAPVHAILIDDLNQDGYRDVLLGGNNDTVDPKQGRYDASYGWYLGGSDNGCFKAYPLGIEGQVTNIIQLKQNSHNQIMVARNDQSALIMLLDNIPQ